MIVILEPQGRKGGIIGENQDCHPEFQPGRISAVIVPRRWSFIGSLRLSHPFDDCRFTLPYAHTQACQPVEGVVSSFSCPPLHLVQKRGQDARP
jgi:hypothetical protein